MSFGKEKKGQFTVAIKLNFYFLAVRIFYLQIIVSTKKNNFN